MNSYSKPQLLADGTTLLITANNLEDLKMRYAPVLNGVSERFLVTRLPLNICKTNVMKLINFQGDPFLPFYINKNFKK